MTTPNQCQFWDCAEAIPRNYFLCSTHFQERQEGEIDECPSCGQYKAAEYEVCLNCRLQGQTARQSTWRAKAIERDDREFASDQYSDRFFVYILLLNSGEYYIGQTRDMRERLHEHRNNMTQSTRGKEPKLQWFTTVQTRPDAADLEVKLQRLNSHPTGHREITRWVTDFRNLVEELDYEPHQSAPQPAERERRMPHGAVAPPSSRRRRRQPNSAYQDNMADFDVDDLPF